MKKTNLIFVSFFCFSLFISSNLLAKFKLDFNKAKKKVERAVNDSVKQTKDSFKKVLNKASRRREGYGAQEGRSDSKEGHEQESKSQKNYKQLAKVLVPTANSVIEGLDIYDIKVEKKLKKLEKCLQDIRWGKDEEFAIELNKAYSESKEQAQKVLHDKLVETYPDSKTLLITFAVELDKEQQEVGQHLNELNKILQDKSKIKKSDNREQLDKSIEKLNEIENNLEMIIKVTNDLLG